VEENWFDPDELAWYQRQRRNIAPLDVLVRLSRDKHALVRRAVAWVWDCPPEILRELVHDESFQVAITAQRNPGCPLDVLRELSQSADAYRHSVAGNRSCPPELLERLLNDELPMVAAAAAKNPNLPRHLRALWQLAH
jgi:hypothetical protein